MPEPIPFTDLILIIIAATSVIIALLLGVIAMLLFRTKKTRATQTTLTIDSRIEEVIDRIGEAVRHHADVSAVVKLIEDLNANPDALELIKTYPETVRAAVLLHRVNTLGADLQHAQELLSRAHRGMDVSILGGTSLINARQHDVDEITAKLDAAVKLAGITGLRSV